MNTIIYVATALVACAFGIWRTKKDNEATKRIMLYFVVMVIAQIGLAVTFGTLYEANSIIFSLKRMLLLAVLWAVAYTDFYQHRISNMVLLVGLIGWAALKLGEFVTDQSVFREYLITECVYAGVIIVLLLVIRFITKGGIGMGDIKLLALMGLLEGSGGLMGSIMFSCIVIFVIAVILMITRRKNRKDELPFAPALLLGSYLSIILTGA